MITNNDVMKKLRVALHLRDKDIIQILKLADFEVTESQLSAIFRREDHPNYVHCGDQLLRRFLDGLIIQYRGKKEASEPGVKPVPAPTTCEPVFIMKPMATKGKGKRDEGRGSHGR